MAEVDADGIADLGLGDDDELDDELDEELEGEGDAEGAEEEEGHSGAKRSGAAGSRKRKRPKLSRTETTSVNAFVDATLGKNGQVTLRAVGKEKANRQLAGEGKSLLAVYEWLVEKLPPAATFQSATRAVPGAEPAKINGFNQRRWPTRRLRR